MSNLTDFLSLAGGGETRTTGEVVYFLMNERVIENPENSTYIENGNEYLLDGNAYLKSSYPTLSQIVQNAGCNSVDKQFTVDTSTNLISIIYANGLYLALDVNGKIFTSTNLTSLNNWTIRDQIAVSASAEYGCISYTNGYYYASGVNRSLSRSVNGITWETATFGLGSGDDLNEVIYAYGSYFVPSSVEGLETSTNGKNWTSINVGFSEGDSLAYGNGRLVIVGRTSGGNRQAATSTNGVTWTAGTFITGAGAGLLDKVNYGNGLFVAVAINGIIFTSTDNGLNWSDYSTGATNDDFRSIAYGNGRFYAIGGASGRKTSTDGVTWTSCTTSPVGIQDVTYSEGRFLYCATNGTVGTSTDFNTKMYSSINAFDGETEFYLPKISKSNYNILQETSTLTNAVFRSFYKAI